MIVKRCALAVKRAHFIIAGASPFVLEIGRVVDYRFTMIGPNHGSGNDLPADQDACC
jgi:hypothetical protein